MIGTDVPRWLIAHPNGEIVVASHEEAIANMGISPAMSAAADVLIDAGITNPKTYQLVMTVERNGQDPEAFARHFVKLARALKAELSG